MAVLVKGAEIDEEQCRILLGLGCATALIEEEGASLVDY
jgi:hypothetical protein